MSAREPDVHVCEELCKFDGNRMHCMDMCMISERYMKCISDARTAKEQKMCDVGYEQLISQLREKYPNSYK